MKENNTAGLVEALDSLRVFCESNGKILGEVFGDYGSAWSKAGTGVMCDTAAVAKYRARHLVLIRRSGPNTQAQNPAEGVMGKLRTQIVLSLAQGSAGLVFWTDAMRLAVKQLLLWCHATRATGPGDRSPRTKGSSDGAPTCRIGWRHPSHACASSCKTSTATRQKLGRGSSSTSAPLR